MAAITKGTAHLYGIGGTVTNATVQSFNWKNETKNNATTEDEAGNEIERRYDDNHYDATVEIKIRAGFTFPAVADVFIYETVNYEVVSIDRKEQNKTHKMATISIKRSQYCTST